MVSTQKRFATKNSSRLTEWLTKPHEKKPTHDQDLEEALEQSQKEHVAEQHRIYQEARKSSKGKQPMYGRPFALPTPKAPDTDDEDDIFQTVSTRLPHIKNEKKLKRKMTTTNSQPAKKDNQPVKKEKEDKEEQFIIDDVSEWLGLKKEKQDQEEEVLEIENVSSWLQQDDPVMTAKTEKQDEQEETLEIDDVSAWLEEDNDEMNQDALEQPKKKQRRVRCHICNKLVERDTIRAHTRLCTMEDDDDVMTNGATIPSSSNINDRSATLYTPSSSNNNERSTTLYSSSSSNNNDRSATLYAPSSSHHHHNNNSYNNSNSNSSSSSKQECPICFKLFDINEIEAHSANCNFEQDDMQLDHFSHHNDSFEFNMDNNPAPDTHEESYEFNMEHQVYNVDSGDDTSECSFIDMSSSQFNEATIIPSEEEDDGYLSPLEGHVNILENPERYQQFFNQFSGSSTAKSTRGRSTTPRATTARSNRGRTSTAATKSYFARKNYYKNRGRGGRGGYGRRGRGKSV